MLPVSLCASAYDFVADGIAYTITSFTEFECSVVANDSSYRGDITIPETVSFNGRTLTVKSIGDKAFYQNEALTSVTIPATVTTIGQYAFRECINLQTVALTDGLTDIGRSTFSGCSSIESIELPASLTKIGDYCFSGCTALSKIELPAAVSELSDGCFSGCSNLKYMDLSNVETIGDYAFSGCTNLAEVKFGDKLRFIGSEAFENCGFEEFTIPNSVTSRGNILKDCDKLQSLTIGNGITRIEYNDLISGCTNIKKFIIADEATALTYDNGESYEYQILYGNAPFEFVYIGRDMVSAQHGNYYYYPPFKGNTHIKTVEIGEFVTDLPFYDDYGFFENCTSLDSIKIWGLPTIPENFAKGDTALKYVEISNKTTKIESGAFDGCTSLETIVLKALTPPTYSSGFTSDLYLNCRLLIPEGTEALYKNVSPWNNFWNIVESPECFTEFTVGDLKYTIITGNEVSVSINDSTGKQNVQIPSQVEYNSTVYNVVSIAGEGFANSTELTAISLPSSIKRIGENAFQGCDNLNVVISKNPEAPITFKEVFSPNIYETATLFLPNGRESSYAADKYWRLFKNIRQSELVPIDSLKFEEKELAINLNESKQLVPHIYPDSASIQKLKWTSSAPDIVSVEDDGTIASNTKKGEATITATTTDGTNISDSIIVKVGTEAGIGEVISENATISVSAENNTIVITGKPAEQIVNVYDIQGRLIATTTQDVIKNLSSGFYIVSVAGKTFKITI